MEKISSDVTIIGGGLTGLAIAYFLHKKGVSATVLEARNRLGGRIYTIEDGQTASQEMGATWFSNQHVALKSLLKELKLESFEQVLGKHAIYEPISTSPPQLVTLPNNSDPSYRIRGGSSTLIKALANQLNQEQIFTNQIVKTIKQEAEGLSVKSNTIDFKSAVVISTLPPYLMTQTIDVQPRLPDLVVNVAEQTHTWMGDAIKVALTYKQPFWRAENSSGTLFSNVGPIPEMYDHSDFEESNFALKGFFNSTYFPLKKTERLEMVLKQLQKYFGKQARNFNTYEEVVWRKEAFTYLPYRSHVLPHQNNGHTLYQKAFLEGQFYIAGSETATNFPGYMEGAIKSAEFIVQQIKRKF